MKTKTIRVKSLSAQLLFQNGSSEGFEWLPKPLQRLFLYKIQKLDIGF